MATTSAPPAQAPSVTSTTVRELPPEEWWKLRAIVPEGYGMPNPGNSRVVTVEDEGGKIVGFWFVFATLHVEPFSLDEAYRGNPGILKRMWAGVRGILDSMREGSGGLFGNIAFAVIPDVDLPRTLPMARRLKFQKLPGSLYFVIPELADPRHNPKSIVEPTAKE